VRRGVATVLLDVRLQARSRLYHIGLALAVALGLAARHLVEPVALRVVIPVFFLLFLGSTTYMFGSSMVLLERTEGTLGALRVTPLRVGEYVASKVITLSGFALVESAVVLLIAVGPAALPPAFLPGALAMGVLYTLLGLAQVAPHDTVTGFLVPGAMVATLVLQLPLFPFFGLWPSPLWHLVPTYAPLVLLEAAVRPIAAWEWVYGVGYCALTIAGGWWLVRRRFVRHLGLRVD